MNFIEGKYFREGINFAVDVIADGIGVDEKRIARVVLVLKEKT